MTRVLLTGGSGFIAAHVLELLLKRGHSVVTTVRSQSKADQIAAAHPTAGSNLSFAIVEDISLPDAFAKAVVSVPPFKAVVHTASPFHFSAEDIQRDLLDPAVNGTRGVLRAIKQHAPEVNRVVITSSFAAIIDPSKGARPEHTYSEADWSPLDNVEAALESQASGYRASKTMAEKEAWAFLERERPNFSIATLNPPLVLGPVIHYLNSLDAINTSNATVLKLLRGEFKGKEFPPSNTVLWVDVRDIATAHVEAMERGAAANKRFFVTAGYFTNKDVANVIRRRFPEYRDVLPSEDAAEGTLPDDGVFKIDNSRCRELLDLQFRSLDESVVDLVKSLKAAGA
ncbi:MAG: methylglyoxal reductase (NADPH-dependent) gre2 [Chrysothrix sp. TS-e1954]|nr:MAG: methylglyoxal reductase (NADPH-dependent) gre2 [Chrysothrix sp. TS-e1954]